MIWRSVGDTARRLADHAYVLCSPRSIWAALPSEPPEFSSIPWN